MPRVSTKENKNIYFRKREELNLTREEASLLLETMAPERIEKIENERTIPHPDEVLLMAEKYKSPQLCNYYCANECPIGKQYVPEIKIKDLSAITLEMLASLNSMHRNRKDLLKLRLMAEYPTMNLMTSSISSLNWRRYPLPLRLCSSGQKICWQRAK